MAGLPPIPQPAGESAGAFNSLQRCPVCEGRGCVLWDPAVPYATAHTSSGPWRCPTCRGARVLNTFGQVEEHRVPQPGTYPTDPLPLK